MATNIEISIQPPKDKKDLGRYLLKLTTEARMVYLSGLRNRLGNGDLKQIYENLSTEGLNIRYQDVLNVFRGISYNEKFAPQVVSEAIKVIELKKLQVDAAMENSEAFFKDIFNE